MRYPWELEDHVMEARVHHRGAAQNDPILFGPAALPVLEQAAHDVVLLLDRGYRMALVTDFVGSHYQLDTRQRQALQRSLCSSDQRTDRLSRRLDVTEATGRDITIDGFNLVIALEVALSGGIVLEGRDGTVRDLAGLRGSYHIVEETEEALRLIGRVLHQLRPTHVTWLLDAPVSNSGRLRSRILKQAANSLATWEVRLVADPDSELPSHPLVVGTDSVILDRCGTWLSLAHWIVLNWIPNAWRIRVLPEDGPQ